MLDQFWAKIFKLFWRFSLLVWSQCRPLTKSHEMFNSFDETCKVINDKPNKKISLALIVSAPKCDSEDGEVDFENRQLNQLLSLISTLLSPVRARQDFLPDFSIDFKPSSGSDKGSLSPQSDDMWAGSLSVLIITNR